MELRAMHHDVWLWSLYLFQDALADVLRKDWCYSLFEMALRSLYKCLLLRFVYSIFYLLLPLVSFFLQTFILPIHFASNRSFSSTCIFYLTSSFIWRVSLLSLSPLSCIIYKEIRAYGTMHDAGAWNIVSHQTKALQALFQIKPRFLQHTPLHIHPDLTWVGWLAGWSTLLYGVLLRTCTCIYSTYQFIDFIPLHVFSFIPVCRLTFTSEFRS